MRGWALSRGNQLGLKANSWESRAAYLFLSLKLLLMAMECGQSMGRIPSPLHLVLFPVNLLLFAGMWWVNWRMRKYLEPYVRKYSIVKGKGVGRSGVFSWFRNPSFGTRYSETPFRVSSARIKKQTQLVFQTIKL